MIKNGIGMKYLKSFYNSYKETDYVIKESYITTKHGVTQGKTTSANYFSFNISDMGNFVKQSNTNDFMDPFFLFQLADDTTIVSDNIQSFIKK